METNKGNAKKIAPVIRQLKLGEQVTYPAERRSSVENTKYRVQRELKRLNRRYTIHQVGTEIFLTRIN